jgi:predicted nucleotidyltransferase
MSEHLGAVPLPEDSERARRDDDLFRSNEPQDGQEIASFEKQTVDEEVFVAVLKEAYKAFEDAGIPFVVIGGVASAVLGRPRWTQDVDFLVRPQDAKAALEALEREGFATQETYPDWLYKGVKHGVIIDVLFKSSGGIYLDDDMLQHAVVREWAGLSLRMASAEDVIVMKAVAHEEATPRYWFDALAIIARSGSNIDWDYLLHRARIGVRRVLSLLLYAQSNDLVVPSGVVRTLFNTIEMGEGSGNGSGG